MATTIAISIEEYLRSTYEHDREFVRGEVIERGMPNDDHSRVQVGIVLALGPLRQSHDFHVRTELRCRLAPDVIRIPDVAVYSPAPAEQVPTNPPLIAIEILSPDDRFSTLMTKCAEYHEWGVRHVWAVDPAGRRLFVFDGLDLRSASQWELTEAGIVLLPEQIFD